MAETAKVVPFSSIEANENGGTRWDWCRIVDPHDRGVVT